jgi:hypothetical protein
MVTRHDLKHVFGNVQTDYLQAVHGGDDLSGAHPVLRFIVNPLWLSEDLGLSPLSTLMPYPSEDPTHARLLLPD